MNLGTILLVYLLAAFSAPANGIALAVGPDASADTTAHALVRAALETMGGEARWRSLGSVRIEGIGHRNALEQSERPEGPWIPTYVQFQELHDRTTDRVRRTESQRGFWAPDWRGTTLVADRDAAAMAFGERWGPAQSFQRDDALDRLDLGPAGVLLSALDASDLTFAADTTLQGVPHRTLRFRHQDRSVRLYLNAETGLPTGYAAAAPLGSFLQAIWGDEPRTTLWSLWSLEPGGWMWPRQEDVRFLGQPLERSLVDRIVFDAPAPADSFAMPTAAREAFVARSAAGSGSMASARPGTDFQGRAQPTDTLAPGIVTTAGSYATTLVEQADGVVVLEAPMTSAWSAAVLDQAARRFPGKPVKAVISTSDAWPHIGGLREYVARGIPVLLLERNVPLVRKLLAAPRDRDPDQLARAPRGAEIVTVTDSLVLGDGPNRLVVHPVRGEGGERMMAVFMPGHRLLYASDLVQIQPNGRAFWPEYLHEVVTLAQRHGLAPETVFAMHTPPVAWTRIVELLDEAKSVGGSAPR